MCAMQYIYTASSLIQVYCKARWGNVVTAAAETIWKLGKRVNSRVGLSTLT